MLTTLKGGCLAGATCLLLTASASAQLEPTSWSEFIRIRWSCCNSQDWTGQDPASPEFLIHSLASAASSIEGAFTFGPPGPPFVTAHSEGHQSVYFYSNYSGGITQGAVVFQLRIIEKAPPPAAVEYVPLMITLHGSVRVSGALDASGSAAASMRVMNGSTQVFAKSTEASTDSDPGPILLDASSAVSIQPGVVLDGSVTASALVSLLYRSGADVEATASVGPSFEITSDVIPGTDSQYRDYFEIEYSPGYWALVQTPVAPTTWGKLKTFYSND